MRRGGAGGGGGGEALRGRPPPGAVHDFDEEGMELRKKGLSSRSGYWRSCRQLGGAALLLVAGVYMSRPWWEDLVLWPSFTPPTIPTTTSPAPPPPPPPPPSRQEETGPSVVVSSRRQGPEEHQEEHSLIITKRFLERACKGNLEATPTVLDDAPDMERVGVLTHPSGGGVDWDTELRALLERALGVQASPLVGSGTGGWQITVPRSMLATADSGSGKGVVVVGWHRVPPYGYGKSHGLSKIIKVVGPPPSTSTGEPADLEDYIRWHCRLSHVSAHTRMLALCPWRDLRPLPPSHDPKKVVGAWAGMWVGKLLEFLRVDPGAIRVKGYQLIQPLVQTLVEHNSGWAGGGDIDLVEEEVSRMADWPCGAFEGPHRDRLGPACGEVPWIHCNVPYDICGKGSC